MYLSIENRGVLDKQLQETYGELFAELLGGQSKSRQAIITLRKVDIPPLVVRKTVRRLERVEQREQALRLERPRVDVAQGTVVAYTPSESGKSTPTREVAALYDVDTFGLYGTAQELGRVYRLCRFEILDELRKAYPGDEVPASHLPELARQVEGADVWLPDGGRDGGGGAGAGEGRRLRERDGRGGERDLHGRDFVPDRARAFADPL